MALAEETKGGLKVRRNISRPLMSSRLRLGVGVTKTSPIAVRVAEGSQVLLPLRTPPRPSKFCPLTT